MKRSIAIVALLLFLGMGKYAAAQEISEDFNQLIEWMTGEYSNSAQAKANPDFENIRAEIARIWPDKTTGAWLYVEEAKADSADSPFYQAVFFLSELSDGEHSVDIYSIPDAEKFIGAWKNPALFDSKTVFDLKHIPGCAWFLNYDGFQYSGKTNTGSCKTNSERSEYSTTEITLLPAKLEVKKETYSADNKKIPSKEDGRYILLKE